MHQRISYLSSFNRNNVFHGERFSSNWTFTRVLCMTREQNWIRIKRIIKKLASLWDTNSIKPKMKSELFARGNNEPKMKRPKDFKVQYLSRSSIWVFFFFFFSFCTMSSRLPSQTHKHFIFHDLQQKNTHFFSN